MEREGSRNFSIDPYIDSSGIMGQKLELNESAASSVMRRTALRRDFVVTKGYGREVRQFEGDEALAVSTAKVHNQRELKNTGNSEFSDLIRDPDHWVLYIHDQQIDDKVEEWMKKHYKAGRGKTGPEVSDEKFVKKLAKEAMDKFYQAFLDEKKEVFFYLFKKSKMQLIAEGVLLAVSADGIRYFVESLTNGTSKLDDVRMISEVLLMTGMAFSLGYAVLNLRTMRHAGGDRISLPNFETNILKGWELLIPNPSIPSLVAGHASFLLNSGKLIRLKQS